MWLTIICKFTYLQNVAQEAECKNSGKMKQLPIREFFNSISKRHLIHRDRREYRNKIFISGKL